MKITKSALLGLTIATVSFGANATPTAFAYDESGKFINPLSTTLSSNGQYIAYSHKNQTTNLYDIYVTNRLTNSHSKVLDGLNLSIPRHPAIKISGNGQYLVFSTTNENLVENDTNGKEDVFLLNISTGDTTLISKGMEGQANDRSVGPSISYDGSYISYNSVADNILPEIVSPGTYFYDVNQATTSYAARHEYVSWYFGGGPSSISSDGSHIIVTNPLRAAQLVNMTTKEITAMAGDNAKISQSGRYVVTSGVANMPETPPIFQNYAPSPISIYDLNTKTTQPITALIDGIPTEIPAENRLLDITGEGRFIVFQSSLNGIVSDDNDNELDTFILDRSDYTYYRITFEGFGSAPDINLSDDGHYMIFGGYIAENPAFTPGYCSGYSIFN